MPMRMPLLALALLLLPFSAAEPAGRTETRTYVAVQFVPVDPACKHPPLRPSFDIVPYRHAFTCFGVLPGEGNVSVVLEDAGWSEDHPARYLFLDAQGRSIGNRFTFFCRSFSVEVPEGAASLFIELEAPAPFFLQWPYCPGASVLDPGREVGRVRATFTP